jgi:hypothetical protein
LALELYVLCVYRLYHIESTETMSVNEDTFQFKSPVVGALAVGVVPAESYNDRTSLLRRDNSDSSLDPSEQRGPVARGEAAGQTRGNLPEDLAGVRASRRHCSPVSPEFERHGAIVPLPCEP